MDLGFLWVYVLRNTVKKNIKISGFTRCRWVKDMYYERHEYMHTLKDIFI